MIASLFSNAHSINALICGNKERVRALRFPFTSFEEQRIIVSNIESRFSVFDSIEQTIDTSLQRAEALRQSILKQAFEGGL